MSDDIVARLRDEDGYSAKPADVREAADEIERLRADNAHLERLWLSVVEDRIAEREKTKKIHDDEIEQLQIALKLAQSLDNPILLENERLRAALTFYRDEWLVTLAEQEPFEPTDALWDDKGEIARIALKGDKNV